MAVFLSPVGGAAVQFFDNSGNVLTGGKLYTYLAGTTTPTPTYTSAAGTTFHTNPIILDAAGRVPAGGEIWLADGIQYKFVLKDANEVLIGTYDNIIGINSNFLNYEVQQEIVTATAGQTVFNLTTITYAPGTNTLSVFVDGVNQYGPGAQYAYIETDSDTVTFVNGLHVGALVKFTTAISLSSGVTTANLVTYNEGDPGAVDRTVESKLQESISVKDFGAVGDGVTDDTVAFQNAVDAAEGQTLITPTGSYRLGPIQLKSNSRYEFGSAIFYPSAGTGDLYLFELNAKTNVHINGGTISVASYTPVGTYSPVYSTVGTSWPNGYFYGGTAIQIQNGCSYVTVQNTRFEGCLGSVNIYDSNYVVVHNTVSYNGLAAYSTVATTNGSVVIGVQLINNQVIGGGDDSFILTTNNSTGNASLNSCIIAGNYMDKTRLFASATPAAVGIRIGQYGAGTGKIYGCVVSDNVLRNMITQGLYLGNMVDCTITNNIVDGFSAVTGPAFAFGASPVPASASNNIVFTGNQCLNQDIDAVCVDINFVTNANFSNNIFNGNSGFANISGINNTYIQFIGNVFANTSGPAFRLTGTSNYNTYLGNDVSATNSPYIVTVGANNIQQNNQGISEIQTETPANAGTVAPDMNWTKYLQIACTGGVTSFTVGAAINSINNGRSLTVSVRNQNGASGVTTTWNSSYQIGTWGSLADGFTRSITFIYNSTLSKWVEISRSSDIPN